MATTEQIKECKGNYVREVMRGRDHGEVFRCSTEQDRKPAKVFRRGVTNMVLILKGSFWLLHGEQDTR